LNKNQLRQYFRSIRNDLSLKRKKEAQIEANHILEKIITPFSSVLSFASYGSELDLWETNKLLAKNNKLILPKTENNFLELYWVNNLDTDLKFHPQYSILEPIPNKCRKASLIDCKLILVPGLAFDEKKHRLGYGKGFYDMLLEKQNIKTIGLGYKEQLFHKNLPKETHDVPLKKILLF